VPLELVGVDRPFVDEDRVWLDGQLGLASAPLPKANGALTPEAVMALLEAREVTVRFGATWPSTRCRSTSIAGASLV